MPTRPRSFLVWTITITVLTLTLAACGGSEEEGVNLQVAAERPTPTASPEPAPAAGDATSPALPGRLLYRTGQAFELLDLASGEVTHFDDLSVAAGGDPVRTSSPVSFSETGTRGVFVDFPNFGVMDLTGNTLARIANNGSFPGGLRLSPDGQWIAAQTGGEFVTRLQLISTVDDRRFDVAASSQHGFFWAFTPDSEFLWAAATGDGADTPAIQRFDVTTGESVPVGADGTYEVLTYTPDQVSPDGTRIALVRRAFGLANAGDNPDACFDSVVELVDLPLTHDNPFPEGTPVYTETRLVAASPQWIDDTHLLFVKLGEGACGDVEGDALRQIMLLDVSSGVVQPVPNAGPLGNATDPGDFMQNAVRTVTHLFAPSPDSRYVAWVAGGTDQDDTRINVTAIATGDTQTVVTFTRAEAGDAASYIERVVIRQVVWLD